VGGVHGEGVEVKRVPARGVEAEKVWRNSVSGSEDAVGRCGSRKGGGKIAQEGGGVFGFRIFGVAEVVPRDRGGACDERNGGDGPPIRGSEGRTPARLVKVWKNEWVLTISGGSRGVGGGGTGVGD